MSVWREEFGRHAGLCEAAGHEEFALALAAALDEKGGERDDREETCGGRVSDKTYEQKKLRG